MRGKLFCSLGLWMLATTLAVGLASCSKEESSKPAAAEKVESPAKAVETAPKTVEVPPAASAVDDAKVMTLLAKADALDGQTDKVVSKCASCMLTMDGKPEHSLKAMDYTMHFCSANCAQKFGEDLTGSILAMKIPGG